MDDAVDKTRRGVVGALAAIGFAGPFAAGSRRQTEAPITLRYSSHVPRGHGLYTEAFLPFSKLIDQQTQGRLRFVPFTDKLLHGAEDGFKATVAGITDYTHAYVTYQPGSFKLLHAPQLPFLFPSPAVATLVVEDLYPRYFKSEYERMGVYLAHCDCTSPYNIIAKRPIRALEDLHGIKMRVTGGITAEIFRELGSVPVPISAAEVYPALQRGIVDAVALSASDMVSYRLQEIGPYYTRVDLNVLVLQYSLNRSAFDALTGDLKELLYRAFRVRSQMASQNYYSGPRYERALSTLRDAGVEMIELDPEERSRWQQAVAPLRARFTARYEADGLPARKVVAEMAELAQHYASFSRDEISALVAQSPVRGIIDW